ncbi:MAG TPA: TonB-dependent receptor, partial [Terriglobales bacterium]|nr:TonB-dependent receptor [Terriglobales bacterium]
ANLPLNGRNYTYLSQIVAGVTTNTSRVGGTGGFTANGLQWSHNSYLLDGIDNNNDTVDFLNGAAYVTLTPPDAIQEVKVQTSNFNAEYGRAGSAVLQATTKSGTNAFHGDVWEFFRNDALDANSFFNNRNLVKKPELRQNQFGVTVGGPIVHNKIFFFGDYQGLIVRQQSLRTATVPTAQMVSSGFTNLQQLIFNQSGSGTDDLGRTFATGSILDPATTRAVTAGQVDPVTGLIATKTGFVRDPFFQGSIAGITNFNTPANEALMNILPANRLDPNAIKLLSAFPAANVAPNASNNFGLSNNYQILRPQPDNTHQFDIRVDDNMSASNQIFARYSYQHRRRNILNAFTGAIDNSGFGQGDFPSLSHNAALSSTHVFSPTMINEARLGYSRLIDSALPAIATQPSTAPQFGIQGAPQGTNLGGLPIININGLTGVGPGEFASPNTRASNTIQLTENLTKIHESHTFKGGFEGQFVRFAWDDPADPRGRMDFGTNYTGIPAGSNVGSGIGAILLTPTRSTVANGVDFLGGPTFIRASSNAYPDEIRHYYGLYFQDDWKTSPNLTLNLGLRWEFFGQPRSLKGEAIMVPNAPGGPWLGSNYIISSNARNLPLSSAFTSQLAKDGIGLQYSDVPGLMNTPKDDFAPRVGLAYSLLNNLVFRASYGIFYAGFENIGGAPDPGTNYPFGVTPSLNENSNGTQALSSQFSAVFPGGVAPVTLENALTFVTPNPTSPAYNPQGSGFEAFALPWKTGSTHEWSFFLQYALTSSDSIQLGYVGNHSIHQINGWRTNVVNQIVPPGTKNQNLLLQYPDFGQGQDFIAPNGDATYNGVQVTYERRMAHGVYLLANYTQSRCKLDFRNILNDQNPGNGTFVRAPGILGTSADWSLCGDDSPRVVHVASTFELPFGHGRMFGANSNGFVNQVLGGWDLNGIFDSQSGFPFSVGCPNATVTDGLGCTAFVVPGVSRYAQQGPHGIDHFLNQAAFSNPPVATALGQSDLSPLGGFPTQVHGPGYNDVDLSLFKEFPVAESKRFELRGEFFNIL